MKTHDRKLSRQRARELEDAGQVAMLRPDDASGYIFSGGVLARLGRFEEAAEAHQRGTRCSKGCVDEAHYNLGLIRRAQERFDDARRCFERALEIDPTYPDAPVALADVLAVLKRQEAVEDEDENDGRLGGDE